MGISRIPPTTPVRSALIASTGDYPLTLGNGVYRVKTDTVQSIAASALYLADADDIRYGFAMRGGLAYAVVPSETTTVNVGTGTFPMLLDFEAVNYSLLEAPTNVSASFTGGDSSEIRIEFTPPVGAVSMVAYIAGQDMFALTTASAQNFTPNASIGFGVAPKVAVAGVDSNGITGATTKITMDANTWVRFLTSGTYVVPVGYTRADIWVVSGGGAGRGLGSVDGSGGGGGGGRLVTATNASVSGSITVTIGAGGVGSGSDAAGANGGTSSFGTAASAAGGTGGGTLARTTGGASGSGNAGGTGITTAAGGGGGQGAAGSNGSASAGGAGGTGAALDTGFGGTSTRVSGGGGGGGHLTGGTAVDGGGAGGAQVFPSPGNGNNATANTGGGGGGGNRRGSFTVSGGSGGSGLIVVRMKP